MHSLFTGGPGKPGLTLCGKSNVIRPSQLPTKTHAHVLHGHAPGFVNKPPPAPRLSAVIRSPLCPRSFSSVLICVHRWFSFGVPVERLVTGRLSAVFSGMEGGRSSKSQVPSSKETPSSKFQRTASPGTVRASRTEPRRKGWRRGTRNHWKLGFGVSLALGTWRLEFPGPPPGSTENSEDPTGPGCSRAPRRSFTPPTKKPPVTGRLKSEAARSALLGLGLGLGLHLGRRRPALVVAFATMTLLHFIGLSAHNFFTLPNCFCWLA